MKVGRLRHRVILQRRVDLTVNGEVVPSWTDLAEVWASIEPLSGREYFAAQQVNAETSVRILIRWRSGVDAAGRILHQTNQNDSPAVYDTYDVVAALEDPVIIRRWITLLCTKRVAEGWRSGE